MLFSDYLVVLRGGGDLATGVAYRLHQAGFPILILELERPLVVRRAVALATAVTEGRAQVEGLQAILVGGILEALALAEQGLIPVVVSPHWLTEALAPYRDQGRQLILIDARMAKRNLDTDLNQADLVIALGPGFEAGQDCHAVIETMRGHRLGRVIWHGSALPNTGTPGLVAGKGTERVLRAPVSGVVRWQVAIGDRVEKDQLLGQVGNESIHAPFAGVVRGLIAPGSEVWPMLKIGDVDARADVSACFSLSDKALAIGGGVLEAVLTWINESNRGLPNG